MHKNWAEYHASGEIWLIAPLPALDSFPTLFQVADTHTFTHTLKMCWCLLPWGCVYMQHPVQLVLNPQRAPRCRQQGREDTRTGPEPLETNRNPGVWSSILNQRHWLIPQRESTAGNPCSKCICTSKSLILYIVEILYGFHADCKKCWQSCGEKRELKNFCFH